MSPCLAVALTALVLVFSGYGCSCHDRDNTGKNTANQTSASEVELLESLECDGTSPAKPRLRPEQARLRRDRSAKKHSASSANSLDVVYNTSSSLPETEQEANVLMDRLNMEINSRQLEPAVARHWRATFRGRLLAAGLSRETIETWVVAD